MAIDTAPTTASHDAHLRDAQDLAQAHGVNPDTGLHADEATRRAAQHGTNELEDHARRGGHSEGKIMAQVRQEQGA